MLVVLQLNVTCDAISHGHIVFQLQLGPEIYSSNIKITNPRK
jgi:hypothetical protein